MKAGVYSRLKPEEYTKYQYLKKQVRDANKGLGYLLGVTERHISSAGIQEVRDRATAEANQASDALIDFTEEMEAKYDPKA